MHECVMCVCGGDYQFTTAVWMIVRQLWSPGSSGYWRNCQSLTGERGTELMAAKITNKLCNGSIDPTFHWLTI